jgi:hypothetical protein
MRLPDMKAIEDALNDIAEWLVACHGERIAAVSLTLEGFYGRGEEYWGIVSSISRSAGETSETLSSRGAQLLAEGVFVKLFPNARFIKNTVRDVRDVARSRLIQSSGVSAHRRLVLLSRFGRPAEG